MLHDRARIHVQAGAGGDGCLSFRREAHVPRGGPDGGDGGHGGTVVFVCDDSLRDLQSFRRKAHHSAGRGGHGEGALRHGADGETLTIRVPPGTQIVGADEDGGDLGGRRWELLAQGQRATVARGGRGGKGNKRFATPTRQAPRFAERGLAGEEGWLELRLRLLADVGLVGLPNAGKSSLLARLTRAAPKIASYPFTTLSPVLGVLEGQERQLILADIPGLIEGASEGAGLGHEFLAHVERTRLLVHVLDIAPELSAGDDAQAISNHAIIERELAAHNEQLAGLPRVLALSKSDLVTPERVAEALAEWQERLGPEVPVIATSSATGAGLQELAAQLLRSVAPGDASTGAAGPEAGASAPAGAGANGSGGRAVPAGAGRAGEEQLAEHMVFRPSGGSGFQVERLGPRSFAVRGRGIERLLERYDIDNDDAMAYVEGRLRRIGVLKALEAEGFQPGDEIEIAGVTFELDPSSAG
ncbi:MAG: GTP-binding protein Obg/CgtA [Solirubrobacterales bacterium]|jgi:GTP-binding protein|nr:GTP-binding protein Obg/CgtA [Solirubrobacterales bacterium]